MATLRYAQKRKKKRRRRLLLIFLLFIFITIGTGSYIIYQAYDAVKGSHQEINRPGNKSELREEAVKIGNDPVSILLMGIEDYETDGQNGRADTQIVVTLNPETAKMTMTTVPRDTMMNYTAEEAGAYAGTHKINSSYAYGSISGYGSTKLTVEKVEELLNVPIDEYVSVDFQGFVDIVDALGGVTVDVKEAFTEKNIFDDNNLVTFEKGPMKMNGEEALAFVRMRKHPANTVYSREERQRQFIKAAIDQSVSARTIFKLNKISDIVHASVDTSLTPSEIYALQRKYKSMDPSTIKTLEIEGTNSKNGVYYFTPLQESLNDVSTQLKQELKLLPDETEPHP
ncbi:LCP family protein [Pontibacillus litoralis]|uniref:LytR family transcriptional regulator n=1 Tax=Pontibacillus litoralis JSM 072002 TaxID=1385512 RepID=A0A0A5G277_9BACI|nr:LCP family protein [Pontibacillus litoralis]KGX87201.1 LytR family transcriptional regulator [Pontibacillus litoralis JSM 072002]